MAGKDSEGRSKATRSEGDDLAGLGDFPFFTRSSPGGGQASAFQLQVMKPSAGCKPPPGIFHCCLTVMTDKRCNCPRYTSSTHCDTHSLSDFSCTFLLYISLPQFLLSPLSIPAASARSLSLLQSIIQSQFSSSSLPLYPRARAPKLHLNAVESSGLFHTQH